LYFKNYKNLKISNFPKIRKYQILKYNFFNAESKLKLKSKILKHIKLKKYQNTSKHFSIQNYVNPSFSSWIKIYKSKVNPNWAKNKKKRFVCFLLAFFVFLLEK